MVVSSYSYMPTAGNQHLNGAPQLASTDYFCNQSGSIFENSPQVEDTSATTMNPKDFMKGKKVNQKAVDKAVNEANQSKSEASQAKKQTSNAQSYEKAKKTPEEKAIINAKKDLGKLSKAFVKLGQILPPDIAGEFGETNAMFATTSKTFLTMAVESRKKFMKLEKEGLKLINKGIAKLKAGMKTLKAGEIISNIGFALEVASWVMFGVALGLMSNPFTLAAGIALKVASVAVGKIAIGMCISGLALMGVGFIMIKTGEKKVKKGEKRLNESDKEKKRFNKYMKSLQKVSMLALGLVNSIQEMIAGNLSNRGLATSTSSMGMNNPFGGGMPQTGMPQIGLQDAFSFDGSSSIGAQGQSSLDKSSHQDDQLLAAGAARLGQGQKAEIRKMMTVFKKHMKKMMEELNKVKKVKTPSAPPQAA